MAATTRSLCADTAGVWQVGTSGSRTRIEWSEVYRVSGHKLDGITEVDTVSEGDIRPLHKAALQPLPLPF